MLKPWIYDRSPLEGITFEDALQSLKKELLNEKKSLFQEMISKYFLTNNHRVSIEMIPDVELELKQTAEENAKLAQIKSSMKPEQIQEIITQTTALREAQERIDSPEAKASIPKLALEDIDPVNKEIPITVVQDTPEMTLLTHPLQSNGILYVDLALDYSTIPIEDIELLPLFTRLLLETNTNKYSESELNHFIGMHTGGLSVSSYQGYLHQYADPDTKKRAIITSLDDAQFYLLLRSKVVKEKIPVLFELIQEILFHSNLNNQKRAVELLREFKASRESSVITAGHSYASARLAATNSLLGYYQEATSGLSSVRRAGSLLKEAEDNWEVMQNRLENIRQIILRNTQQQQKKAKRSFVINLTGDEQLLNASEPALRSFLSAAQKEKTSVSSSRPLTIGEQWKSKKASLLLPLRNEGFVIPSLVNYVGLGGNMYSTGESTKGSTSVVNNYLSNGYLWDNVRVLGGAYGGFSRFAPLSGRFVFLSYRDPNLLNTINAYKQAPEFLKSVTHEEDEGHVSSEEILQSIIGSIGDIDAPLNTDQKGYSSMIQFLSEETKEYRQQWRNDILHSNLDDFKDFHKRLEKLVANPKERMIIVFGSQEAIQNANKEISAEEKLTVEPYLLTGNNNNNKEGK
jgi:Zn-dependent M16 (insulinase) family peptidase